MLENYSDPIIYIATMGHDGTILKWFACRTMQSGGEVRVHALFTVFDIDAFLKAAKPMIEATQVDEYTV